MTDIKENKSYYFDLIEAAKDISKSKGAKETSVSSAKLLGKTLFNTGVFAGEAAIHLAKNAPKILEENAKKRLEDKDISSDEREKIEKFLDTRRKQK